MRGNPSGIGWGFLAIALGLFGIATFMAFHAVQETRIGQRLIVEGEVTQALVVTAERIERTQCSRSQRAVCWPANSQIATVVYQIEGLRWASEIRLAAEEYDTYLAGSEVFLDLIYLPSAPAEVERARGARLARAEQDFIHIYILAGFGLLIATIGSIALLIARKQSVRPSTGPGG